jgi:hypothetical protein
MKTYSITLSSTSLYNVPTSVANLANVKWNVNWSQIFGNKTGECNVRTYFISIGYAGYTTALNVGTIHCSLNSTTSISNYGLTLAPVHPISDTSELFLEADTTNTNGVTCQIPIGNGTFELFILNRTETGFMVNVTDFQITLFFDVQDDLNKDLFH